MNWYKLGKKESEIVEPFLRSMPYGLSKKAQTGEWWIINDSAQYADGDIGDTNHSGYVIGAILANYDIDADRFDLTKETEESLREKGLSDEEINVVFDKIDPRIYGMKNLGWKRVAGRNIQTQTLTEEDLKNIDYGLYDAYEQELESDNSIEFNIEVMAGGSYYTGVPYSVISIHNPLALREYQQGIYAKSNNWYKYAQIWNVPTEGGIEEKVAALYELEYKYSMLRDRNFSGVPERKENILAQLESNLSVVLNDVKDVLIWTFDKWLKNHALLDAETWSEQRAGEASIENMGAEDAYNSMLSEYIKYAIHGGEYVRVNPQEYNEYFREMLNKALRNIRYFPALSQLYGEGLNDYRNMLYDDLSSEGLEEFGRRYGKKFRNEEQAQNFIGNLSVKDVDAESLLSFDDISSFADRAGERVLVELYKKFVFPHWVSYWKGMGIAGTRKTVANIYRRLQAISDSNIKNSLAIISLALNAAHQTGDMLTYIAEESGGDIYRAQELKAYLDEMTKGAKVEEWNQQLREIGVQI